MRVAALRVRATLPLFLVATFAATARCTLVTHAGQFAVGPATLECYFCPSRPDLRHVPCPPAAAPAGPEATYAFALRSIDLGADPATWHGGYRVGRDLDCSDRPNKIPDTCTTLDTTPGGPWVALPDGIDNSFAAQFIAPLTHVGVDLEGALNAGLTNGAWGVLLRVDKWNGLPDDDEVEAELVFTSVSADGGVPPKFDGTDQWSVCGGFDGGLSEETTFNGGVAYVVGGQLVWDFQSARHMYLWNAGAQLDITLVRGVLMGQLSPAGLTDASLSGVWPSTATNIAAEFLAGCDRGKTTARECGRLISPAADVHLATDPPADKHCTGLSIGLGMTFVQTSFHLVPTPELPTGCFASCSYGQPDCGVDGPPD
jgi:hypothetical protein